MTQSELNTVYDPIIIPHPRYRPLSFMMLITSIVIFILPALEIPITKSFVGDYYFYTFENMTANGALYTLIGAGFVGILWGFLLQSRLPGHKMIPVFTALAWVTFFGGAIEAIRSGLTGLLFLGIVISSLLIWLGYYLNPDWRRWLRFNKNTPSVWLNLMWTWVLSAFCSLGITTILVAGINAITGGDILEMSYEEAQIRAISLYAGVAGLTSTFASLFLLMDLRRFASKYHPSHLTIIDQSPAPQKKSRKGKNQPEATPQPAPTPQPIAIHTPITLLPPLEPAQTPAPSYSVRQNTASSGQRNDIFISYSRANKASVLAVKQRLTDSGFEVWMDTDDIPATSDWMAEIYTGIESAHTFLFFMSEQSLSSFVCHLELSHARAHNKRIITVVLQTPDNKDTYQKVALDKLLASPHTPAEITALGGRDFEQLLMDNYWNVLKRTNWVFLDNPDQAQTQTDTLIHAIQTDLIHLQIHNNLQADAMRWRGRRHDNSLLLKGSNLAQSRQWLKTAYDKSPPPTPFQEQYIEASLHANRRAIGAGIIGMIAVLIIIGFIAAEATRQFTERESVQSAKASQDMIARAQEMIASGEDYRLAIGLALEAIHGDAPLPESQIIATDLLFAPGIALQYERDGATFWGIVLSADGDLLYTNDMYGEVLVWDWRTGEQLYQLPPYSMRPVVDIVIHPNQPILYTLSIDSILIVYDTDSRQIINTIDYDDPQNIVFDMALSPDGKWLVLYGETIQIVDTTTFETIHTLKGHVSVNDLSITLDGRHIVSAGTDDRAVIIWDIQTGETVSRIELRDIPTSIAIMPDNITAYIATSNTILEMDLVTGTTRNTIESPLSNLNGSPSLELSADGSKLALYQSSSLNASTLEDRYNIALLETATHAVLQLFVLDEYIYGALFTPDNRLLVGTRHYAVLYDKDYANRQRVMKLTSLPAYTTSTNTTVMAYQEQGLVAVHISSNDSNKRIVIYNTQTQSIQRTLRGVEDRNLADMAFLDTSILITITSAPDFEEAFLVEWDVNTGDVLRTVNLPARSRPQKVAISPDGRYVAVAFSDDTVVYDRTADYEVVIEDTINEVNALAFSSDSTVLYANAPFNLFKYRIGDEAGQLIYNDCMTSASPTLFHITPTKQYLISASGFSIAICDIQADSLTTVQTISISENITRMYLSADEQFLYTQSPDGMRVISLSQRAVTRHYRYPQIVRGSILIPQNDEVLVILDNLELHALQLYPRLDDVRTWASENRAYATISCSFLRSYGATRPCNDDQPVNAPRVAQFATLPHYPTFTPSPTPAIEPTRRPTLSPDEEAQINLDEIRTEVDVLQLDFEIIVPQTDTVTPSLLLDSGFSEDEQTDSMLRSILLPGERFVNVIYDNRSSNESAFSLYFTDSPFATLDDWHTNLGVMRVAMVLDTTPNGNPFSRINEDAMPEVQVYAWIYGKTFVSMMVSEDDDITNDAIYQFIDTFFPLSGGIISRSTPTPVIEFEQVGGWEFYYETDLSQLGFEPYLPEQIGDYRLFGSRIGQLNNPDEAQVVNLLLNATSDLLVMGYTDKPRDVEVEFSPDGITIEDGIVVLQTQSIHQDTRAWYEADSVIRSFGQYSERGIGRVGVISFAFPETEFTLYMLVKNNILVVTLATFDNQDTILSFLDTFMDGL